jgi:hypothetical protein
VMLSAAYVEASTGKFRRRGGVWPRETALAAEAVAPLCRYAAIATGAGRSSAAALADAWAARWMGEPRSAFGVPLVLVGVDREYGKMQDASTLSAGLMQYAAFAERSAAGTRESAAAARELASRTFGWMSGANPFASSFIEGVGSAPSVVPFFLRPLRASIGGLTPGFHHNANAHQTSKDRCGAVKRTTVPVGLSVDWAAYQATEGTVIGSAPILDVIAQLHAAYDRPASPSTPSLRVPPPSSPPPPARLPLDPNPFTSSPCAPSSALSRPLASPALAHALASTLGVARSADETGVDGSTLVTVAAMAFLVVAILTLALVRRTALWGRIVGAGSSTAVQEDVPSAEDMEGDLHAGGVSSDHKSSESAVVQSLKARESNHASPRRTRRLKRSKGKGSRALPVSVDDSDDELL